MFGRLYRTPSVATVRNLSDPLGYLSAFIKDALFEIIAVVVV